VRYWVHNNMITINGQKMARSLGNFITLDELFGGSHKLLTQAYTPMTIRFFVLQAHYRGTLDFSNEALISASAGLQRLMTANKTLGNLNPAPASTTDISNLEAQWYEAMNDELNTPVLIAGLFEAVRIINLVNDGKESLNENDLNHLKSIFRLFVFDILGLKTEDSAGDDKLGAVISILLDIRQEAKAKKEWAVSDHIRKQLSDLGIVVKDRKDGYDWEITS